ncbi:MAG: ATP-binding protein [Bacteroidia bacterium]|nr:ATP-binding protein [Bacteroidia bacterium]
MNSSGIKVPCTKSSLALIREYIENSLQSLPIDDIIRNQITLAVDEASANCIIHGNKCDETHSIEVILTFIENEIRVEIFDSAPPYQIQTHQPIPIQEKIKCAAKGGLGISLILKIMDEVDVKDNGFGSTYKLIKRVVLGL